MHLNRLDIYGFKSFGQDVHLEIPQGITALVGPNGGGKSNIVDAIRWALGEQRIRDLRADRWEELLFNGSSGRSAAKMAEVTLTFDNQDGEMPDWPEALMVTRRYYRSGQSEYLINGRPSRLKDVTDLFLDSGLGRFNYAVIGQGKVEAALLLRPSERLEQLEEAAGVSRYKVRRKETVAHLAEARRQLARVEDLLAETERQMAEVKARARTEEHYLGLETVRQQLRIRLELTSYRLAMQRARELEAARSEAVEERSALQGAAQAMETRIVAGRAELQAVDRELAGLRARWQTSHDGLLAAQAEAERLQTELSGLERERAHVQDQADLLRQQAAEAEQGSGEASGRAAAVQGAREREEELASQAARVRDQMSQVELLTRKLAAERAPLDEQRQQRERQIARWEGALNLKAGEDLGRVWQMRREEAKELERLVRQLTQELVRLTDHRQTLRDFGQKLEREVTDLRMQLAQRQARLRALHHLEAEGEGLPAGVRAVLKAQQDGILGGILGTLGSLVDSDPELGLAIQTALAGSALDVVVGSETEAQAAVRHLKTHALGRATFLPLDTIRTAHVPERDRSLSRQPGVVGWALDLVKFPRPVAMAVMHALGRVLVTQNLEVAVRLGRLHHFRYRTVTLDGQLLHAGGAITGGSRTGRETPATRKVEMQAITRWVEDEGRVLTGKEELLASSRQELDGVDQEIDALREILADRRNRWTAVRHEVQQESATGDPASWMGDYRATLERLAAIDRELASLQAQGEDLRVEWQRQTQALTEAARAREQAEGRLREYEAVSRRQQQELLRMASQIDRHAEQLEELARRREASLASRVRALAGIEQLAAEREASNRGQADAAARANRLRDDISQAEKRLRTLEYDRRRLDGLIGEVDQQLIRLRTRWESYRAEEGVEPFDSAEVKTAEERVTEVEGQLAQIGPVVAGSLALYRQLEERFRYLSSERDDVLHAETELQETLAELDREVERRVGETAERVEQAFKAACRTLYGGGDAGFLWGQGQADAGLELWVEPPGKRRSNIALLSGGEKALGGIAWLFALLYVRPAPFVVLDEVEASLDEANAARFAQLVTANRTASQYMIVTHHKVTMEAADALWGVAGDGKGMSRLVSVMLERDKTPAEV
ncbi:MAG: AAA family ATPase [Thermaerobacter sp.]|nr:AAA family ATPase [Thermaerobacter sp.]